MIKRNTKKMYVTGIVSTMKSGSAYLTEIQDREDIYIHKTNLNQALHLDRVKASIRESNGRIECDVIEILERNKTTFVGRIERDKNTTYFIPNDEKIQVDFYIPNKLTNGCKDGQRVVVKFIEWKLGSACPIGEVTKILGDVGNHETEIHSILEEFGLPYEFPKEVSEEADKISIEITQEEIKKREDFREVLTYTIDSSTARDLDDAISLDYTAEGNIRLGVHIADVTHYLKPNTELYKETLSRGTSVYLSDRCVPMIPEKLSNDLCSLNPNTDKLVLSFMFILDKEGKIIEENFYKGIINSNYRLTYDHVNDVITNGADTHNTKLKEALIEANKYALLINKIRNKEESLTLGGSEVKFKLDASNKPIEIYIVEQNQANKLIEEFMVLTNTRACRFLSEKGFKTIHRTHDTPNIDKLESLSLFVKSLGYNLDISNKENIKTNLNKLLKEIVGTSEEVIVSSLATKCMSKANYQTENIGHWGLGLDYYSHVTSPIRRISDYFFHLILSDVLEGKKYVEIADLDKICQHISKREKLAQSAERASVKYMQGVFHSNSLGKTFTAIVSYISKHVVFVMLEDSQADCILEGQWEALTNDGNIEMEVNGGVPIKLGDRIQVTILEVDLITKKIYVSYAY